MHLALDLCDSEKRYENKVFEKCCFVAKNRLSNCFGYNLNSTTICLITSSLLDIDRKKIIK